MLNRFIWARERSQDYDYLQFRGQPTTTPAFEHDDEEDSIALNFNHRPNLTTESCFGFLRCIITGNKYLQGSLRQIAFGMKC
jgi:hypothetical protein